MDPMLEMLRRDEQEDFDSSCTITRPGESATWDGSQYVDVPVVVYSGGCTVRAASQERRLVQAGGRQATLSRYEFVVPHDVPVAINQTVTVGSSPDPLAAGLVMRVIDVPKTDWLAARMFVAEEEI